MASFVAQVVKNLPAMRETWVGKIPWKRERLPTPVLLPRKSHGRRSLVGCSPWGREESDITFTFHFHFHFSLSYIGDGNGNPLQCSCLENPRGGGAWWAAVYGVAQSRTRLSDFHYTTLHYTTRCFLQDPHILISLDVMFKHIW